MGLLSDRYEALILSFIDPTLLSLIINFIPLFFSSMCGHSSGCGVGGHYYSPCLLLRVSSTYNEFNSSKYSCYHVDYRLSIRLNTSRLKVTCLCYDVTRNEE